MLGLFENKRRLGGSVFLQNEILTDTSSDCIAFTYLRPEPGLGSNIQAALQSNLDVDLIVFYLFY